MTTPFSRRHLIRLGGGAAALGALAACGSNTGRQPTPSGPAGASLSQWYHQYGEAGTQDAVKRYAAGYQRAQVQVEWKVGDYDQTTAAALLTDHGPDVFEYSNGPTIDMIRGGQVADMTAVVGAEVSDFNPAIIQRYTHDGKIWAVPQVVDCILLVYRPSLLKAAGVQPPTTLSELADAARALTQGSVKGLYLGNDGGAGLVGGNLLWSVGLDFLTADGTVGFDDPKAVTAWGLLASLWKEKVTQLVLDGKGWWAPDALTTGQAAMAMTGLWNFPDFARQLGDDYAVVPWPAGDGGRASVTVGAYGSCVSTRSRSVAAAQDFARWLWVEQTEHQLDFATSYGFHIPSRTSLLSQAKPLQSGQGKDAVDAVQAYGHAQNQMLWTPKCQTVVGDMLTRIVKEGADPAAEIASAKPQVEAEVSRVRGR